MNTVWGDLGLLDKGGNGDKKICLFESEQEGFSSKAVCMKKR